MQRDYTPKLKEQQIIPYFKLPSSKAETISPWDYKQKKNLAIVFFHGADCAGCRQLLSQFAGQYQRFQEVNTEVLAISVMTVEGAKGLAQQLNLPFPVLADEAGTVSEQYTYVDPSSRKPAPAVFVVDRYGALYSQAISEREAGLPDLDAIIDWLFLIELQCPECGVSEWTVPGS